MLKIELDKELVDEMEEKLKEMKDVKKKRIVEKIGI